MKTFPIVSFASFSISVLGIGSGASAEEALRPKTNHASPNAGGGQFPAESERTTTTDAVLERRAQIEEFHNAKMAMLEEMAQARAQVAKGGAKAQREAVEQWQKQNAVRMQAIQEQASIIASTQPAVKPAPLEQVELPENATEEVKGLLNQRALLYNGEIAVNERMEKFPGQSDAILKDWHKKRDADRVLLRKLAQAVAEKSARQPFLTVPQTEIPAGVRPEVRALLIERNALLKPVLHF